MDAETTISKNLEQGKDGPLIEPYKSMLAVIMALVVAFLALFTVAPVFFKGSKLEKAVSWTFITGFLLTLLSFILISAKFGIFREYWFEIAVISIDWLVLIISGIMLTIIFKRKMRETLSK